MRALLCRVYRPASLLAATLFLTTVLPGAVTARAQLAEDLEAIHTAEQQHRSPAELGAMWGHLATEYHSAADFLKAEDAYNRSLHLLKDVPDSRALYATTLDNLAALYLMYGRTDEAETVRKQSLKIRQQLGNRADIGVSEVHVADIAIARHQYKKAEQFAMRGIDDMNASPSQPEIGMLSALVTITYARCLRGHTADGLASAQQAFQYASAHFQPDSAAVGFSLQTLGFAEWKNGDPEEGGKTMQRALKILRSKLVPSDRRLVGTLLQYESYLTETRHRPEADEIRDEVARTNTQPGAVCPGCTISVYSLAKGLR
jgi:tetratricopeptide (TPR) repeat protein